MRNRPGRGRGLACKSRRRHGVPKTGSYGANQEGAAETKRQQNADEGVEAGSDPRGHLWVTWGVYLCAGKPPLTDIILSHPPDLT